MVVSAILDCLALFKPKTGKRSARYVPLKKTGFEPAYYLSP